MATASRTKCRDCGCLEGELHELACFQEKCPFCGHQLQTCNCFMEHISPRPGSRKVVGRAVDAFDGMTADQEAEWERALKREGRIPFIVYPNLCARCGKLWPPMFMVSDKEWVGYVEPARRREMLCRRCYGSIKKMIRRWCWAATERTQAARVEPRRCWAFAASKPKAPCAGARKENAWT